MANNYPIPREKRITLPISGNGDSVYGPFNFKIFDVADVEVRLFAANNPAWHYPSFRVEKIANTAFDNFRIIFAQPVGPDEKFIVLGHRLADRLSNLTRGGTIISDEFEKEFSKIAVALQEMRRDIDEGYDLAETLADIIDRCNEILYACEAVQTETAELRDFAALWATDDYHKEINDGRNKIGYSAYSWAVDAEKQAMAAAESASQSTDAAAAAQESLNEALHINSDTQSKLDEATKGSFGFDPQKIYDEGYVTDTFYYFTRDEGEIADLL